ncbi:vWA domain-containing protein [Marivita hallyeonensis]|uniref:Ca-activated chloride channel family protein n=1 Tax=Marivita hallyeonensis TaxID=996342 RepID=A0A1M5XXJ7_9RHOB|nr:VWA domain-containing protein [Marivita hallyeonensis]SHI04520.1 Ca-activated chloride channel family protein [Marivita hallyeonensis]
MRFALALALLPTVVHPDCTTDAMLVFDGSTSMIESEFGITGLPKIAEAQRAMARALPQIEDVRRIGLMIYGPQQVGAACEGISLQFMPMEKAAEPILQATRGFAPGGLTPLTKSVARAAEVMNYRSEPGVIVLLTDGNETCGGRPCELGPYLAAQAYDLTVHVIGFQLNPHDAYFQWNNPEQTFGNENVTRCLADATGGLYVTTDTIDELAAALQTTLGCPVIGRAMRDPETLQSSEILSEG